MFQTVHPECHQQRSFTLKMHRNRWRLGLCRRPHWGAYSAPPKPPSWIKGGYFYGKGRREGEERAGEERDIGPSQFSRQINAPGSLIGQVTATGLLH